MTDEDQPSEHEDDATKDEALLRRQELLAKVREANKQSISGPDSPALHRYWK